MEGAQSYRIGSHIMSDMSSGVHNVEREGVWSAHALIRFSFYLADILFLDKAGSYFDHTLWRIASLSKYNVSLNVRFIDASVEHVEEFSSEVCTIESTSFFKKIAAFSFFFWWQPRATCSKSSISASSGRQKENLIKAWVLHSLTPSLSTLWTLDVVNKIKSLISFALDIKLLSNPQIPINAWAKDKGH